jgi:hypothetical protein
MTTSNILKPMNAALNGKRNFADVIMNLEMERLYSITQMDFKFDKYTYRSLRRPLLPKKGNVMIETEMRMIYLGDGGWCHKLKKEARSRKKKKN